MKVPYGKRSGELSVARGGSSARVCRCVLNERCEASLPPDSCESWPAGFQRIQRFPESSVKVILSRPGDKFNLKPQACVFSGQPCAFITPAIDKQILRCLRLRVKRIMFDDTKQQEQSTGTELARLTTGVSIHGPRLPIGSAGELWLRVLPSNETHA